MLHETRKSFPFNSGRDFVIALEGELRECPDNMPGQSENLAAGKATSDVGKVQSGKVSFTFGDITKYTVFLVFALYSIGFLIWHSYLDIFGVSPIGFLQSEYIASAICYLLLVSLLIGPPLVYIRFSQFPRTRKEFALGPFFLMLWAGSLVATKTLYFHPNTTKSRYVFVIIGAATFIQAAVQSTFSRRFLDKWYLRQCPYTGTIGIVVGGLLCMPLLKGFWCTLLGLLVSSGFVIALRLEPFQKRPSRTSYPLFFLFLLLWLMCFGLNLAFFSKQEFGSLPRFLGGGKPEFACFKASAHRAEIASLLSLDTSTNSVNTNALLGPVAILWRSDKEILFLDCADGYPSNTFIITNLSTNVSWKVTENRPAMLQTNQWTLQHGNVISNVARKQMTNVVTIYQTNVVANKHFLRTKQIRADFVDAIIFLNDRTVKALYEDN
jgi:hypothetical protein